MRSSNKSHDQKQKEKIYMDFTEIAVEFIQGEGKRRVDNAWQPASDGEACVEASSKSEIFCAVYPQRINFVQGVTHRTRKE